MSAAPIIIIINRPRESANRTRPNKNSLSEIQVLLDESATDAEVLAAAIAQIEANKG